MTEVINDSDKNFLAAVSGNEKLGYDTYKLLANEGRSKPGNILICPLSVETVLALTYMGAVGETAKQMADTLHIPNDKVQVADGFRKLTNSLKSENESVRLSIANKIFVSEEYKIAPKFHEIAVSSFNAETENVDFKNQSAALQSINGWVSKKTEDKIKDILNKVEPETVTVLVNAVYFNGLWQNEFKLQPFPMEFTIRGDEKVEVPSLNKKAMYNYYEDETLQMVELPYKGGEYSLVIVLPREVDGLEALESQLPIDLSKMNRCEVDVTIPKFKLESTIEFTDILPKLGMVVPFSDAADFSELLTQDGKKIQISKVIQKCFIDVNEKGTEAAAATAVTMSPCCMISYNRPPKIFKAKHPFMYILQQTSRSITLFMGKLTTPPARN